MFRRICVDGRGNHSLCVDEAYVMREKDMTFGKLEYGCKDISIDAKAGLGSNQDE